jgi:hypothetical protein
VRLVPAEIFRLELFSVRYNVSKRDKSLRAFTRLSQNNHALFKVFLGDFQKCQSIEDDWDKVRMDKDVRGARVAHLVSQFSWCVGDV